MKTLLIPKAGDALIRMILTRFPVRSPHVLFIQFGFPKGNYFCPPFHIGEDHSIWDWRGIVSTELNALRVGVPLRLIE